MQNARLRTLLLVFFLLVFAVSLFFVGRYYWESAKQRRCADTLTQLVSQALEDTAPATQPEPDATGVPVDDGLTTVTDPQTGAQRRLLREYAPIFLLNPQTVGWIRIDGTHINYPVMQSPDSPNYYLSHSFEGESARHGAIYAQENCNVFLPSDNVVIYGHRMRDGLMFYDLQEYKEQDFFLSHPTIVFDTICTHGEYAILAVFLTSASSGQGFAYHEFVDGDKEAFDQYVSTCKALSLYDTGVSAHYGDKLITLSTCEYSQTNGRLVVVAKRMEPAAQ